MAIEGFKNSRGLLLEVFVGKRSSLVENGKLLLSSQVI
jgi:hypothetical protein